MGTLIFPGVRRSDREADHSLPSSAMIKNEWSYISAPPVHLHGVDRANITLVFKYSPLCRAFSLFRCCEYPRICPKIRWSLV
jgi:hypothetical protein